MSLPSPESLALLERAAELRATGTPWPDTAKKLAVGVEALRTLAAEFQPDYDRLARRARDEVFRDTFREALTTLRNLLATEDTRTKFLAATTIVRCEMTRMRLSTKEAGDRVEYDTHPLNRNDHPSVEVKTPRARNTSESPKVQNQQEVNAAKKVAQPTAPPVTPKPATPAPAAPVAAKQPAPQDDAAARRKRLLVDKFALGHLAPAMPGDSLLQSWLTE